MKYLLSLCLALSSSAMAGTLYTEGRLQVQQSGPPPAFGNATPCSNSSGVCSGVLQLLPPLMPATNGMFLLYGGNSNPDYGVLRVAASAQTTTPMGSFPFPPIAPYNIPGSIELQQTAGFRDTWNITGGTAGAAGVLELFFEVTGVWTQGNQAYAHIQFASYDGPSRNLFVQAGALAANGLTRVDVPFVFGQNVDFRVEMQAEVSILPSPGLAFTPGTSASANGMNTGRLTSAVVRDSLGNIVPTWYLTTESGSVNFLNIGQSSVPEPSSYLLFSGALVALGLRRRGKRSA